MIGKQPDRLAAAAVRARVEAMRIWRIGFIQA
jgi:hypothetical protein